LPRRRFVQSGLGGAASLVLARTPFAAVSASDRAPALQRQSLDGVWELRHTDGQRGRTAHAERLDSDPAKTLAAQVPGEVHLDLMRAGLLASPYLGAGVLAARWVEEEIWSYRRFFEAPRAALTGAAWLVFDGLDYAATILLNGQLVGKHDNTFMPCRLDVRGKLKAGRNLLVVHLDSGLHQVADKPGEGYLQSDDQRLHKRHWLRKSQAQFSWDWAPRLINVGIFRPVALEWSAAPVRLDQFVPLVSLSSDLQRGSVRARVFVENPGQKARKGRLEVELVEANRKVAIEVELRPGLSPVEAVIEIERPQLWWPRGHGEATLHTVRARLTVEGRLVGETQALVGFRHVRVVQDQHPETGRYFHLEVNGQKIFCKGGNLVPADMIAAAIDRPRMERLVELALEANFNFLRVWGGGHYESDDFFELCNRKGVLVWQDFTFACGKYPATDEGFLANVKREAVYNIRRLARHPSLVIWCGNNENEVATWSWGAYKRGVVAPDYALYHLTLPQLMQQEDPTRYYQPSSPFAPDQQKPGRHDMGDQHPWEVGFDNVDFRDYRKMISRFANEGGLLGPTSLPTMLACLPEGQRFPGSFSWQVHDNSVDSWAQPSYVDKITDEWLGKPTRAMSIEDYVYWGGLIQGEALREYCDNFRRRMFSSGAAVFWMFNDCWPATRSWTIVDYYLRRTPAFHPVRRALAPLSVVVAEVDDEFVVIGINDTPDPVQGQLRCGVFRLAGGFAHDTTTPVTLAANAATPLARFARAALKDPRAAAAFALLTDPEGNLLARNRLFLPRFKELAWAKPKLTVRMEGNVAVFESPTFVWGICTDLAGEGTVADNFFDVFPGIAHRVQWPGGPPKILRWGNLSWARTGQKSETKEET